MNRNLIFFIDDSLLKRCPIICRKFEERKKRLLVQHLLSFLNSSYNLQFIKIIRQIRNCDIDLCPFSRQVHLESCLTLGALPIWLLEFLLLLIAYRRNFIQNTPITIK